MSSTNRENFTSSFPILMPFISFSCLIVWLGLPIMCWIGMMRVGTLILFLILKNFQSFSTQYDVSCRFVIWPLLCWGMFLLYTICWYFLSWIDVEFGQVLLCIYWDEHMIFIFHSIDVMYYIDLCILNHPCIRGITWSWYILNWFWCFKICICVIHQRHIIILIILSLSGVTI